MKEIELKILNINPKEITKKLLKLGAKSFGERFIIEKHFDFPNGRISNSKESFRLRKLGNKNELAYKHSLIKDKNFKIYEEIETEIINYDDMEKIIKKLGLDMIKYKEKKRISFILKNLKIEIDKYPNIPPYLEIEGNEKDIKSLLKDLGYSLSQTTNMNATNVLKHYNVDSNFQKF